MIRRRPARGPDQVLLHRARRVLAMQTAAAVTLGMLFVGVLATVVVDRGQQESARHLLTHTAATADDVIDPPPWVWLFQQRPDNTIAGTPNPPKGFPDTGAIARVRATGRSETSTVEIHGVEHLVLTRVREATVIQVVLSLHEQQEERRRLLAALAMVEMLGLAVAATIALLLARRATVPLGDALTRQRQFVADASHELRAPLTQLHTRAQLLQRDLQAGTPDLDVAGEVARLVTGTRQLGEVVEDLLLSTQLQHRTADLAVVDLSAVAADVVATHAARAATGRVELTLVADHPAEPPLVPGREPALRRVLNALVDNALSHTPPGGHVTLELSTQEHPHQVTLVVRDDGSGFDPADADRLFARFARGGHGDQRRFGLGLALAREVVTGHGGTIEATGTPGAGAAFTIRLPAATT